MKNEGKPFTGESLIFHTILRQKSVERLTKCERFRKGPKNPAEKIVKDKNRLRFRIFINFYQVKVQICFTAKNLFLTLLYRRSIQNRVFLRCPDNIIIGFGP